MYSHFKGRFIQVIDALDMYDACSNHVIHIDEYVRNVYGIKTEIYAKHVHPERMHLVKDIEHLDAKDEDILFFHFSSFSEHCAKKIIVSNGFKILHYHNITPHTFFDKDSILYDLCKKGRDQLGRIVHEFNYVTADSNYNLDEIIALGFSADKTQKLPIIINGLSSEVTDVTEENKTNDIIFVGRICENKCQHKLIEFYHNYSQNNDIGKLYLIGKYDTSSSYYKKINKLIKKLNVFDNVILTGSVSDDELKQYYSQSKCFISFSEHEGFGVPLLEAAQHHIPVLALNAAAVSETLDDSPGVFDNEVDAYNKLHKVLTDSIFSQELINYQKEVLDKNSLSSWAKYADRLFGKLIPKSNSFNTVSIVICTFNRGDYLERCLDYLTKNYSNAFEVIVVNGPSTDNTDAVLNKWKEKIIVRTNAERNLSRSRNIGIEAASGDLIAFIDDDAIPFLDWVDRILEYYNGSHNFVAGVGGPTYYSGTLKFQAIDIFVDQYGTGVVNPSDEIKKNAMYKRSLLGTNSVFRRDYLVSCGGFDEEYDYFLDETDVCFRLINNGYLINHCPDAYLRHEFAQSENRVNKYNYNWRSIVKNTVYFTLTYNTGDKQEILAKLKPIIEKDRVGYVAEGLAKNEITQSEYEQLVGSIWEGFDAGVKAIERHPQLLNTESALPGSFKQFNSEQKHHQKKHIVVVSKEFPPFTKSGGIGTLYYNLVSEFILAGHFVSVIIQGDEDTVFDAGRFKLISLCKSVNAENYVADSAAANAILTWSSRVAIEIDALNELHPVSVVDSCLWDSEAYAFSLISKELNIPLVIRLVTPLLVANDMNKWEMNPVDLEYLSSFEREVVERADAVVPISDSIKRTFIKYYSPSENVKYSKINAGVAYWPTFDVSSGYKDFGTKLAKASEILKDKKIFLFMGRIELRKGIDVLLDAIEKLKNTHAFNDCCFVIAGSAIIDINKILAERFAGIDNVLYIGAVNDTEREKLYAVSDVVVFPSRYESFGLVPLEAFVHGKPVIASDAGAIPEVVIDNKSGLIFKDGSADDLALKIEKLCDNEELYKILSTGAFERVRELSSYNSAEQSIKLYDSLM
ncbi:hypothetical protein WP7S18C02_17640 [Klebsiella sp. WP7-S18-CRE-02]|uniref:glycosyltransferase n=1 Tax=unclassified Klebsiella TaxID=2608929 RepID=UPI0015DC40BE|nr:MULTISPECIES: glycosyltransferase [unclassified Klebsiella]BBS91149.1 hypothetical protein WP7S18C02_17640 [Klebsiella sp. WP7-S18-CRE-02]BBS96172.1 hypothetical protein WP7S18C03_17650 [Klebsiella sp. WP7-S18-CRE-03]BBT01202.1 hypothetical protein WP7S18E04_17640 [Klebsiella sp. WP7-S18-ESBL-04]